MASSIKSQPDPNDLEEFALTKAEKVCHFGLLATTRYAPGQNSLNMVQIRYVPAKRDVDPLGRDISFT